jgi:hypothetical protein
MKIELRNAYICQECYKVTLTVHVNDGVTPMFINCPSCKNICTSFGYRLPPPLMASFNGKLLPTHEWYKPESMQGLTEGEKQHIEQGGVLLRERTKATPVYFDPQKK